MPLGSNRPFFWAANGLLVAVITVVYLITLMSDAGRLRAPLTALGAPMTLVVLAVVWMVIQIIPLPLDLFSLPPSVVTEVVPLQDVALPAIAHTGQISVDPSATLGMIVRYLTYALLCFLVVQTTVNPARARRLVQAVFWIAVLHGAAGIVLLLELGDTLLVVPKWAYEGFATGFFVNRNSFATFMAFGISAGAILAIDAHAPGTGSNSSRKRGNPEVAQSLLVYAVGLAILGTAVVLSASRMGALVSVLGIAVAFMIGAVRSKVRAGGIAIGLIAVAALAAAVFLTAGGQLSDRLGSLESNLDDRLLLYEQVVGMIKAHPWTGYGGGAFAAAFPLFHELPLSADVTWDAAHNLYLELFAELGFAAVLPLLAVVILVVRSLRALAHPGVHWVAPATAVCLTVVAAVHSLVDFSLQIEANVMLYIAVLAAGAAQFELVRRHVPTEAGEPPVPVRAGLPPLVEQFGGAPAGR